MASVMPTPAELPPLARPAFEVEEVPWEELAALDAAMQVAASRQTKLEAASRLPALQGGAVNATLEVVSLTHFALRVPPGLKPRADAALAGLRFEPVVRADGEVELRAPLAAYETVANVLNIARLLRAPARGEHETFDCGGRVPVATLKALRAVARRLQPGEPEYAEQEAREARELRRYDNIPQALRATLLPFQQEGVRIGLRRSGRLLLADEVGVGKTLQALALATAYADEGPVLVICPASLRFMWAEQAERWWPGLVPSACTVVLCSKDSSKLDDLPRRHASHAAPSAPRVVITSYHMLQLLALTVNWPNVAWGCVVVDESHNMCTTNGVEPLQTQVAAEVVKEAAHAILLSGTPALNRPFDLFCQVNALWPGLLGAAKEDFARAYCERRRGMHCAFSNSGGTRLRELHLLLRSTIMLRREKCEVACDLPPVRRQVVRLHVTTRFDSSAIEGWDKMDEPHQRGWLKARAVCDWLKETLLQRNSTSKVVIFVFHIDVMRYIEQNVLTRHLAINEDGTDADPEDLPFVTVQGEDSADARQKAVDRFKRHAHVRVALLSIGAGGEGLDFSSADAAVFAELPQKSSHYTQAEGRVIRRGATGDDEGNINIYTLCAHGTNDETHWTSLSAAASKCHSVHGAHDSDGLVVDDVVDAGPGFVAQPSLLRAERPPSRPVVPAVMAPAVLQSAAAREEHDQAVVPADTLFFEVSCNTGRLHAFRREVDGFKHLDSVPSTQLLDSETAVDFPFPYTSPAVRSAAVAFLAVWNALSAFDRNVLWRVKKPLRLPLDEALEAARAAYKSEPSTKRSVKVIDVVPPPRAGSIGMRYVYLRRGTQRLPYQLHISAEGELMCRTCSKEAARVQHPAGSDPLVSCLLDLCCTEGCHDRLRYWTDPKYLRDELFKLEKGVCQMCHLDCDALFKRLCPKGARTKLGVEDRRRIWLAAIPRFGDPAYAAQLGTALSWDKEWQLWQADHIIPVAEGGGLCGLENMRTLCAFCHAGASTEQAARGAKRRRDAGAALDPHAAAEQAAVAAWEEEGDEDFEGAREAREKKKRAAEARKSSKEKASK